MTFFFARAVSPEPRGLILSLAEARQQRAQAEARARLARSTLRDLLASRRSAR